MELFDVDIIQQETEAFSERRFVLRHETCLAWGQDADGGVLVGRLTQPSSAGGSCIEACNFWSVA